jgi:hypothetical protein
MAPRLPQSVPEYRRIAHAFLAGSRYPAGSTVYAVMSALAPLFRIQGVFPSLREAETVLAAPVPRELGWSDAEAAAREIIEATVPETRNLDGVVVITKDEWTGETLASADAAINPGEMRSAQIESMELVINYGARQARYAIGKQVIAIFVTRGAAEMFLFPHVLDTFGHEYETTLRAWVDKGTGGGSGGDPSQSV